MVDLVLTEPDAVAIDTLLRVIGLLKGYRVVGHWQPEDCTKF